MVKFIRHGWFVNHFEKMGRSNIAHFATSQMFEKDSLGADKRWTFSGVINRLKSISKVESTVNGVPVKTSVSKPDSEQQQILNLLGVQI